MRLAVACRDALWNEGSEHPPSRIPELCRRGFLLIFAAVLGWDLVQCHQRKCSGRLPHTYGELLETQQDLWLPYTTQFVFSAPQNENFHFPHHYLTGLRVPLQFPLDHTRVLRLRRDPNALDIFWAGFHSCQHGIPDRSLVLERAKVGEGQDVGKG